MPPPMYPIYRPQDKSAAKAVVVHLAAFALVFAAGFLFGWLSAIIPIL